MQYFPSLLHTMVHRMRFSGVSPVTPQLLIRTNPRQKDRIFRKTETSDFPRQNIRTFAENTALSCKEVRGFQFPKNRLTAATPRTTHPKSTPKHHRQKHCIPSTSPQDRQNHTCQPQKPPETHPESVIFRHKAKIFRK